MDSIMSIIGASVSGNRYLDIDEICQLARACRPGWGLFRAPSPEDYSAFHPLSSFDICQCQPFPWKIVLEIIIYTIIDTIIDTTMYN